MCFFKGQDNGTLHSLKQYATVLILHTKTLLCQSLIVFWVQYVGSVTQCSKRPVANAREHTVFTQWPTSPEPQLTRVFEHLLYDTQKSTANKLVKSSPPSRPTISEFFYEIIILEQNLNDFVNIKTLTYIFLRYDWHIIWLYAYMTSVYLKYDMYHFLWKQFQFIMSANV